MIAYIQTHFNSLGAVDSLGYIFDLIDIIQAADEFIVALKAWFLRIFASLKMGGDPINSVLQVGFMLCAFWLSCQAVVQEFLLSQHSLTTASLQTVVDQCVSYNKDPWKGPVGHDGEPVWTPLANARNTNPDSNLYSCIAAKPFSYQMNR
jgi:hypothetical protein